MSLRLATAAMLLLLISATTLSAVSAAIVNLGDLNTDTPPILRTDPERQGDINMPLFTYLRNKYAPQISASAGASIYSSKSAVTGRLKGEVNGPKGRYGLSYQGLLPKVGIQNPSYGASVHVAYPTLNRNVAADYKLAPYLNLLTERYSSEEQGVLESNEDSIEDVSRSSDSNESGKSRDIKIYKLNLPHNDKTRYQKVKSFTNIPDNQGLNAVSQQYGQNGQDISDIIEAYINRDIFSKLLEKSFNGIQDKSAEKKGFEPKYGQNGDGNEILERGLSKHLCPHNCWHKSLEKGNIMADFASVPKNAHSIYLDGGQTPRDALVKALNRYAGITESNSGAKSNDSVLSPLIQNLLGSSRGQLSKGELEIQPKYQSDGKPFYYGTKPVDYYGDIIYSFDVDDKKLGPLKWLLSQK